MNLTLTLQQAQQSPNSSGKRIFALFTQRSQSENEKVHSRLLQESGVPGNDTEDQDRQRIVVSLGKTFAQLLYCYWGTNIFVRKT